MTHVAGKPSCGSQLFVGQTVERSTEKCGVVYVFLGIISASRLEKAFTAALWTFSEFESHALSASDLLILVLQLEMRIQETDRQASRGFSPKAVEVQKLEWNVVGQRGSKRVWKRHRVVDWFHSWKASVKANDNASSLSLRLLADDLPIQLRNPASFSCLLATSESL
ncbi:unnamed protein product [Lota lota]